MNPDTEIFEKVTPVDYKVDRTRLVCYSHRIPVDIQNICDGVFPVKEGEKRMRIFLSHLFFSFLTLNYTAFFKKVELQVPTPVRETGCAKFKGANWFHCLEGLHARWEKIDTNQLVRGFLSHLRSGNLLSILLSINKRGA